MPDGHRQAVDRSGAVLLLQFQSQAGDIGKHPDSGGNDPADLGCYPADETGLVFGDEPKRVTASSDRDPAFGIDRLVGGLADFGDGRHLSVTSSAQPALGPAGQHHLHMRTDPDRNPVQRISRTTRCAFHQGHGAECRALIELPVPDRYHVRAEDFGRGVRRARVPDRQIDDTIRHMQVVDASRGQEKSDRGDGT